MDDNVALVDKIVFFAPFSRPAATAAPSAEDAETVPDQAAAAAAAAAAPPANTPKPPPPPPAPFQSFVTSGPGPYLPEDKPAWQ